MVAAWALAGLLQACGGREAPPVEPSKPPAPAAPAPAPAPVAAAAPARDAGGADVRLGLVERVNRLMAQRREEARIAAELAAQEKERVMKFDRAKLPKHTALLAFIKKSRKQLDDTADKLRGQPDPAAQMAKAAGSMRKGIAAQGKVLASIDPKGGNSNITTDHEMALNILAEDYPVALAAALQGDPKPLEEARAELDRRQKKIESWLEEVRGAKK